MSTAPWQDSRYLRAAQRTACEAGAFIAGRIGRVGRIDYKGAINLVTEVDRHSERLIRRRLARAFPRIPVLGEEQGGGEGRDGWRWVVDPLDGTTNFTHGFPFFCVSIGLEHHRQPVVGVIYEPVRRECFTAVRGRGAWLNGRRIHVSRTHGLKQSLLCTGFSYKIERSCQTNIAHFINFLMASQAVRRAGAAALDLAYVACGRFDGFWELDLNPWDTAAGVVLVEEAGGRISRFDGSDFELQHRDILASNGHVHTAMSRVLGQSDRIMKYIRPTFKNRK